MIKHYFVCLDSWMTYDRIFLFNHILDILLINKSYYFIILLLQKLYFNLYKYQNIK